MDEHTPAGVGIGNPVAAVDPDNDGLTYWLGGPDAKSFRIAAGTGQIVTKSWVDYETKPHYSVIVSVTDGMDPQGEPDGWRDDSIMVAILVVDQSDSGVRSAPPAFDENSRTTRYVMENTPAFWELGLPVNATDPDGDPLTYTLGGDDAGWFAILESTGQLLTKGPLDYESRNSYSVTVSVHDGKAPNGAPSVVPDDTILVTILVGDVEPDPGIPPEQVPVVSDPSVPPVVVTSSGGDLGPRVTTTTGRGWSCAEILCGRSSGPNRTPRFVEGSRSVRLVAEHSPAGVEVGSPMVAADADEDEVTYSLAGPDAEQFDLAPSTGQILTKAWLDYETKPYYVLMVSVTDGMNPKGEPDDRQDDWIMVAVLILDQPDASVRSAPPAFNENGRAMRYVLEGVAPFSKVGVPVVATDPEGDRLTYLLGGPDADWFAILKSTGQLVTKGPLDYISKRSYSVTVSVHDGKAPNGGPSEIVDDTIFVTILVRAAEPDPY